MSKPEIKYCVGLPPKEIKKDNDEFFKISFIVMFILCLWQGILTHGVATDALNTVQYYEGRMISLEKDLDLLKGERRHLYLIMDYLEHHR
jgi:hypothetical protein